MSNDIEITETPRGFRVYGDPVVGAHGERIAVYESSNAEGPHVWMQVRDASTELDPDAARGLIARLQAWLDEIPSRWEGYAEPDATAKSARLAVLGDLIADCRLSSSLTHGANTVEQLAQIQRDALGYVEVLTRAVMKIVEEG